MVFPGSYAWSNFTILALGVWAVAQRDSVDAIGMVSGEWERGQGTGSTRAPHVSLLHILPYSVLKPWIQASQDGEPLAGLATQLPTSAIVFSKTDSFSHFLLRPWGLGELQRSLSFFSYSINR